MKPRVYLILVLASALALVTGCGGGDDEESLTKAQFIKQADAICEKQNKKKNEDLVKAYAKLEKEGKTAGKKGEAELIGDVALPPIAQMTEELADLGLPEEQEDQAEQFITEMEQAVAEVEEDPSLALSAEEPFEKPKERATKFGFSDCKEF
jgi:hypothetical protein